MSIMTKRLSVLLLLLLVYTVNADESLRSELISAKREVATFTDPRKSIVITKEAPSFTIKLPNPNEGHSWYLGGYDQDILWLEKYTKPPKNNASGELGFFEWTFNVVAGAFTAPIYTQIEIIYIADDKPMEPRRVIFTVLTSND